MRMYTNTGGPVESLRIRLAGAVVLWAAFSGTLIVLQPAVVFGG